MHTLSRKMKNKEKQLEKIVVQVFAGMKNCADITDSETRFLHLSIALTQKITNLSIQHPSLITSKEDMCLLG